MNYNTKHKKLFTLIEIQKNGGIEKIVLKPLKECEHIKKTLEAEAEKNKSDKKYIIK